MRPQQLEGQQQGTCPSGAGPGSWLKPGGLGPWGSGEGCTPNWQEPAAVGFANCLLSWCPCQNWLRKLPSTCPDSLLPWAGLGLGPGFRDPRPHIQSPRWMRSLRQHCPDTEPLPLAPRCLCPRGAADLLLLGLHELHTLSPSLHHAALLLRVLPPSACHHLLLRLHLQGHPGDRPVRAGRGEGPDGRGSCPCTRGSQPHPPQGYPSSRWAKTSGAPVLVG